MNYGKYALITGAGNGIGKASAEYLAIKGMNLILLDSDMKALEEVKNKIKENNQFVKIELIQKNSSTFDSKNVADFRSHLEKFEIGVLVNNTEIENPLCEFHDQNSDLLSGIISEKCLDVANITRVVLEQMNKRDTGLVITSVTSSSLDSIKTLDSDRKSRPFCPRKLSKWLVYLLLTFFSAILGTFGDQETEIKIKTRRRTKR